MTSWVETGGHGLLRGRVVVVTAAAGTGIGGATARRCAAEGAIVVISDIHEGRLAATAAELGVLGVPCDVTADGAFEELLDVAEAEHGPVDVLVNNAGLGGSETIVEMTDEQWMRVLDVSLTSAFRGTRAALRRMMPRSRGAVVNVASVTGWRAEHGQAHYAAAKAGVMALTRCAGVEAAAAGVRVNAVAPTLAMHPFLEKVGDREVLAGWARQQPQQRAADPSEIAGAIVFLASDYASYLTGEVMSVGAQHP
ncbi:SDR family oxidoreductase [Rhodococcus globerulus]|uniref:SDR family oxidoreductase n=1 Tax=Rhodococcus globerulus TaxID=33008 RepID=UPI0030181A1A